MSGEVNNNTSVSQQYYPTAEQLFQANGLDATGKEVVQAINDVVDNLQCVSTFKTLLMNIQRDPNDPNAPDVDLDEVDFDALLDMDLQKLLGIMQARTDEATAASMKERIEQLKSKLEKLQNSRLEKVDKSIDEQKKADAAAKRNKIFSIFGAIFAVVAAVVATVVTGGAAAGFAIAGAVLAVTNCVLSCTGADKKIINAIADLDQKCHPEHSMKESKSFANKFYAYFGLALGAVCAIGGGISSFAQSSKEVVKVFGKTLSKALIKGLQYGTGAVSLINGGIGVGFSYDSTRKSYKASDVNADLKESTKYVVQFQKFLEQEEEDIQEVIQALQNVFSDLISMIDSTAQTKLNLLNGMNENFA